MPGHDIIVVGASAGGVEATAALVRELPADLPASIFVVHHFPAFSTSVLPQILGRAGRLLASHARSGEAIQPGRIYVAPPNHHLLLARGSVHLARGPRENGHRPAVDPLFRSAVAAYDGAVLGVVLTGMGADGRNGCGEIRNAGGTVVVQDQATSVVWGMPGAVAQAGYADEVLPLDRIAEAHERLAAGGLPGRLVLRPIVSA